MEEVTFETRPEGDEGGVEGLNENSSGRAQPVQRPWG